MKKIFILLFTAVLLYFYSAAQSGDLIKYIPANASIVVDIDCGSLSQKVSRQDLVELKFFDSLVKKAKAESKEKFSDMSESGIDYHDHMYMTITMSEKDSIASVIIYGKVSEEAKLSKLLEKPDDKNVIRKTAGPNKMMMQENFLFGWNSSMFVLYVKKPFNKKTTTAKKLTATEKKKELAALEKICVELMTPKTQSILSNKSFETIAQGKGDFKIWIDNNSMPKTFKGNGPMAAFKMNNLLKADHKAIIVNFDKGSIVSNTYTYYNENSLALAQNLYAEKVNADLIRKIPAGNILGLYAMSFKPGGIKDFLENAGIMKQFENTDNGADKGKAETAAFLNNLKGDLVMAFGLPDQIQENNSETKNPFSNFNIYIAATVNDEAKMSKFIDSLKALTKKRKEEFDSLKEDQYTKKSEFFKDLRSSVVVENGAVFFTAGNLAASSLTSTDNYNDLIQQYGQRPIMMVFDMKTLMSMMVGMINKTRHYSEQDSAMFSMFQVFDKMITSGGKFENDAMVSTLEVKFSNPEESSLKQMLKMFDLAMSAFSKLPAKTTVKDIEVKEN